MKKPLSIFGAAVLSLAVASCASAQSMVPGVAHVAITPPLTLSADALWTLACSGATHPPMVQVLSPNGGETYTAGSHVTVTWKSCNNPAGTVLVALSSTNGNGSQLLSQIDTGTATVTLPTTLGQGSPAIVSGNYYKIAVELGGSPALQDSSDATFTINQPATVPSSAVVTPGLQTNGQGNGIPFIGSQTNTGSAPVINSAQVTPTLQHGTLPTMTMQTGLNTGLSPDPAGTGSSTLPNLTLPDPSLFTGTHVAIDPGPGSGTPAGSNSGSGSPSYGGSGGGTISGGGYNYTTSAGTSETFVPTVTFAPLRPRTRSVNNKVLQWVLTVKGVYSGSLDGSYGPKTKKAVALYQAGASLKADGYAGRKTLASLGITIKTN